MHGIARTRHLRTASRCPPARSSDECRSAVPMRGRGAACGMRSVTNGRTAALKLANSISWKNFFSVVRRVYCAAETSSDLFVVLCFSNLPWRQRERKKKKLDYLQWTVRKHTRKVSDNCVQWCTQKTTHHTCNNTIAHHCSCAKSVWE